jgi:hypothetical protein
MIALDVMLVVLAQSSVSTPAQSAPPAPRPDVEVVGPARPRTFCHIVTMSNSRIPARRVCQTQAENEQQIDRGQRDASRAMQSTDQLIGDTLVSSGYMRGAGRPIDTSRPPPPPR